MKEDKETVNNKEEENSKHLNLLLLGILSIGLIVIGLIGIFLTGPHISINATKLHLQVKDGYVTLLLGIILGIGWWSAIKYYKRKNN